MVLTISHIHLCTFHPKNNHKMDTYYRHNRSLERRLLQKYLLFFWASMHSNWVLSTVTQLVTDWARNHINLCSCCNLIKPHAIILRNKLDTLIYHVNKTTPHIWFIITIYTNIFSTIPFPKQNFRYERNLYAIIESVGPPCINCFHRRITLFMIIRGGINFIWIRAVFFLKCCLAWAVPLYTDSHCLCSNTFVMHLFSFSPLFVEDKNIQV